jgi:hypothetical protein
VGFGGSLALTRIVSLIQPKNFEGSGIELDGMKWNGVAGAKQNSCQILFERSTSLKRDDFK